jgi:hypothetical protein
VLQVRGTYLELWLKPKRDRNALVTAEERDIERHFVLPQRTDYLTEGVDLLAFNRWPVQ